MGNPFGNGNGGLGAGASAGRDTVKDSGSAAGGGGFDLVKDPAGPMSGAGLDITKVANEQKSGDFRSAESTVPGGVFPFKDIDKSISERGGAPLQKGSGEAQTLPVAPAPQGVSSKPFRVSSR
jgi:hypothetical protein